MKKIITTITLLLTFVFGASAQTQPNYAFYNLQQSIMNPAAAASYSSIYAGAIFNTQMQGFKGAPMNGLIDFGVPIGKTNLVIGGQFLYEHEGAHQKTDLGVQLAYRVKLKRNNFLSFGLTPYVQMVQNNLSGLNAFDKNDVTVGSGDYAVTIPNFKIGAFYFTTNFYTGLSIGNLLTFKTLNEKANIQLKGRDIHFYYMLGYTWSIAHDWEFKPSTMVRIYGASPLQFDVNANFNYKKQFGFGVSYRSLTTLVVQLNYEFKNKLRIGYAFNYGFGRYNRATNFTGHEVYVGILFPKKKGRSSFSGTPSF